MDTPNAIVLGIIVFRAIGHRKVRGHVQARRFGPRLPLRSQEQNASLESVMVERESVVMEGENRSHGGGGGEDDQTFWNDSQRYLRSIS